MTRAAEALHVTQPTLSRQISELEREFGSALFVRAGRGLEVTERGSYLRRRAKEIVELCEQTEMDMRTEEGELSGTVRIAAGESWVMGVVASRIRSFQDAHPGVGFKIHTGNAEDVSWRLDQGLADFAIFMARRSVDAYESIRFRQTDAWGLLVPEDSELGHREAIAPADLMGIPLVMPDSQAGESALSDWLREVEGQLDERCTYTLAYNAAMLVREHVGCCLVLDKIVPTGAETGLEFRPLDPPVVAHVDLAWKRDFPLAPPARAFLEHMRPVLDEKISQGIVGGA